MQSITSLSTWKERDVYKFWVITVEGAWLHLCHVKRTVSSCGPKKGGHPCFSVNVSLNFCPLVLILQGLHGREYMEAMVVSIRNKAPFLSLLHNSEDSQIGIRTRTVLGSYGRVMPRSIGPPLFASNP
jgi:hypothetical protein